MSQQALCPHPLAFEEKAARLGWAGWIPTPGVTDEDKELYISLGERHVHIMSIAEALALSDEELQQRIESAIGMSQDEVARLYGMSDQEIEAASGALYPQNESIW